MEFGKGCINLVARRRDFNEGGVERDSSGRETSLAKMPIPSECRMEGIAGDAIPWQIVEISRWEWDSRFRRARGGEEKSAVCRRRGGERRGIPR